MTTNRRPRTAQNHEPALPAPDRHVWTGTVWHAVAAAAVLLVACGESTAPGEPAAESKTPNLSADGGETGSAEAGPQTDAGGEVGQCPAPPPAERSAQGFPFVDQLPSGTCATGAASCRLGVENRCGCPTWSETEQRYVSAGAGYHTEQCDCVNGSWTCELVGPAGSSTCSPATCEADAGPDAE